MKIIILKDKNRVAKKVASLIISEIKNNKKTNLGLATGETVIPLYKILSYKLKKINISKIKTFNLDEYIMNEKDKNSFHSFMNRHLFNKLNLEKHNIHFPRKNNPSSYDKLIKKSGNLDITILGIGTNGHIAFNEPGSKVNSKTRIVNLTKETLRSNSKFFKNKTMPKKAVTLGLQTILKSKKIILIATGKSKAEIISKVLKTKTTSKIPATFLKTHKDVTMILDKNASSIK